MAAAEKRDDGLIAMSADEWMPDADVLPDNDADAPSSSVRLSAPPAELSFKVYTLEELERRPDAPASMRLSRLAFESLPPRRRHEKWRATWSAFRVLASATHRWSKTRSELGLRYPLKATIYPELDAFGDAAQVAVDSVDWRKHGITLGIVIGAMVTLLFGVLLCAEMTDDLKPGSGAHLAPAAALEVGPRIAAPRPLYPTIEAPAPAEEAVDNEPPAAPRPAPRARVKAKGKLTFRNADAVFNP